MTGSGKTTVAGLFVDKGFRFIRFGQVVLDIVIKKNVIPSEKNERAVREHLRKKYGPAAIAKLNYPKFKELLSKGDVIADGLYSWSEYKFLKDKFGPQMVVIAVFSPPEVRYKRLAGRIHLKKDKDLKMRPSSYEDSKKRDFAEIEKIEKGGPIAMADYTLLNTKDLGFLKEQVKEVQIDLEKNLRYHSP